MLRTLRIVATASSRPRTNVEDGHDRTDAPALDGARSARATTLARRTRATSLNLPDAGIAAPALIVWGDRDGFLPRSDQEALAASIAGSRLVTYEGTGHVVHWEEPERLAADIVAMANRLHPSHEHRPHGS